MSTINGVPSRFPDDQAGQVPDRRRPGRVTTDNQHLIRIMRGEDAPDLEEDGAPWHEPVFRPLLLLLAIGLCIAFWCVVLALLA